MDFELHAPYKPTGDQPQAIEKLVHLCDTVCSVLLQQP